MGNSLVKLVDKEEMRADIGSHVFWRWAMTALFGIVIANLDSGL